MSSSLSLVRTRLLELAWIFLRLGCTSFGGPVAHIGYLRNECVSRRHWLDESAFADLVALCQFLPGPASSQLVFALGMHQRGLLGALIASACFTLPSALLMILFAYGVEAVGVLKEQALLHGLKLAAVAVVAQAVWTMARSLCPDIARVLIMAASAVAVLLIPSALGQIAIITLGAVFGFLLYRNSSSGSSTNTKRLARHHLWAACSLLLFATLLVLLPLFASLTGSRNMSILDGFYRSGSLVFGGGHVILPLLRAELVPPGWISNDAFLAGYGAAQALPGPLFTLSAYLGTVIHGAPQAWLGGLACLVAIFTPAWLLIGGTLPFWDLLKFKAPIQAGLRGANAAVVGVLLAALCRPVCSESLHSPSDILVALTGLVLLLHWKLPAWVVVLASATLSILLP